MTEFTVEFETDLPDDGFFDEDDEMATVLGGGTVGELVAAAFRRLGLETTTPTAEDIHGWFWKACYRGRCIDCQTIHIGYALVSLRFENYRQAETFYAILTLLDRELKKDPTLSNFRWSHRPYGKAIELGAVPVDPAAHPDPDAVLASPESYDLPPTALQRFFARLFRQKL